MNEQPADAARAIIRAHAALSRPAEQQGSDESGEGLCEAERLADELMGKGFTHRSRYEVARWVVDSKWLADRLAAVQADRDHWRSHAEEAGRGFDRVCRDAARISAARVTAEAALATARRDADELRGRLAAVEALDVGHTGLCRFPDDECFCAIRLFDLRAAFANPSAAQGEEEA